MAIALAAPTEKPAVAAAAVAAEVDTAMELLADVPVPVPVPAPASPAPIAPVVPGAGAVPAYAPAVDPVMLCEAGDVDGGPKTPWPAGKPVSGTVRFPNTAAAVSNTRCWYENVENDCDRYVVVFFSGATTLERKYCPL
jgi:hypothetical protein